MRILLLIILLAGSAVPAHAEWHVTQAGTEATAFCADDNTMVFVMASKPALRIAWPSDAILKAKDSVRVNIVVDGNPVHSPRWERRGVQTRVTSLPVVNAMKNGRSMEISFQYGKKTYRTTVSLMGFTRALNEAK